MSWWLAIPLAVVVGTVVGMAAGRWWARRHPLDPHYVSPRCLEEGHKWERRMTGVPLQFCRRRKCMGVRVSPEAVADLPPGLVAAIRQELAEGHPLSLDEAP